MTAIGRLATKEDLGCRTTEVPDFSGSDGILKSESGGLSVSDNMIHLPQQQQCRRGNQNVLGHNFVVVVTELDVLKNKTEA